MALITRCPHCATTFRVTPLHLQAHGGDVRCGRCAQVFNAFSTLSTLQEPETGDLDQGKAQEMSDASSLYRPADETSAAFVSDRQSLSTSSDEIAQTEARAEAVTGEAVSGPEFVGTEAEAREAEDPEAVIQEAAAQEAIIQEAVPSEALNAKAEIPEAMVSTARTEASEARTVSPDEAMRGQPESAKEKRLGAGPEMIKMAADPSANVSATAADSVSEKTSEPRVRTSEPSKPKAQRRKIEEPVTREDGAQTRKAQTEHGHAHGQAKGPAKGSAEGDRERKTPEAQEQEPGKSPDHEIAASYAFDAAAPNISPAWSLANLLLLIFLTGQTVYFYRTELATLVPQVKPYLEQYCELLRCSIPLPRHTQLLNIESSDMQADPQHPGVITLSATVRNHASYPQGFPLFELTFIDNQNRPLASRIFKPDAYLGENANLAANVSPGSEFNVRLHLDTGDLNAAGYRLSLLYPNS